jgi:hypothetical protein
MGGVLVVLGGLILVGYLATLWVNRPRKEKYEDVILSDATLKRIVDAVNRMRN